MQYSDLERKNDDNDNDQDDDDEEDLNDSSVDSSD